MSTILFYGEGRLGNQVFQYQALSQLAGPHSTIWAVGLEDLHRLGVPRKTTVRVITRARWLKRIVKFLLVPAILRPLAKWLHVIGYASEPLWRSAGRHGASGDLRVRAGLLRGIVFVDGGYYQCGASCVRSMREPLISIHQSLRDQARSFLQSATADAGTACVFVHVRRGDYLTFHSYGVGDLALPEVFYANAILEVQRILKSAHFVFVTDDRAWVEDRFASITAKTIARCDEFLDFAIMTECDAGILSNSTFSLAAALFMRAPQVIVGPEFWFGFRVREWLPPRIRIEHPRVLYLPVLEAAPP